MVLIAIKGFCRLWLFKMLKCNLINRKGTLSAWWWVEITCFVDCGWPGKVTAWHSIRRLLCFLMGPEPQKVRAGLDMREGQFLGIRKMERGLRIQPFSHYCLFTYYIFYIAAESRRFHKKKQTLCSSLWAGLLWIKQITSDSPCYKPLAWTAETGLRRYRPLSASYPGWWCCCN